MNRIRQQKCVFSLLRFVPDKLVFALETLFFFPLALVQLAGLLHLNLSQRRNAGNGMLKLKAMLAFHP